MSSFDSMRNLSQVLFFVSCFFQISIGGLISPVCFGLGLICIYLNVVHHLVRFTLCEAEANQEDHEGL